MTCQSTYVSGYRRLQPCPYRASTIIASRTQTFRVCGYHARQFAPDVQYPLDWNLARIRGWRLDNLSRVRSSRSPLT